MANKRRICKEEKFLPSCISRVGKGTEACGSSWVVHRPPFVTPLPGEMIPSRSSTQDRWRWQRAQKWGDLWTRPRLKWVTIRSVCVWIWVSWVRKRSKYQRQRKKGSGRRENKDKWKKTKRIRFPTTKQKRKEKKRTTKRKGKERKEKGHSVIAIHIKPTHQPAESKPINHSQNYLTDGGLHWPYQWLQQSALSLHFIHRGNLEFESPSLERPREALLPTDTDGHGQWDSRW